MLKIRRPLGRLIFNMGIAIPGKTVFLIETAPRFLHTTVNNTQSRSELRCISKARSWIKVCIGHKYVCIYEVGCQIVAWRVDTSSFCPILLRDSFETGNEMLPNLLDSFTVHGPWHGLLVSIMMGLTCTHLVRMWNRQGIPCGLMQVFTELKIALI